MLAPIALEHEEARHFKQEEIIRDHDLWDDPGKSNEILVKLVDSAKVVDAFKDLKYKAHFTSVDLKKFLDKYEMSKFLKEPYDMEGACLIIESRRGDIYSETWAVQLIRMYMKWSENQGYAVRLVERCLAKDGGIKSATIECEFKFAYG
ncbi:peptide chain release factor 3, chloroplastic [Olea europaea subsp. europaea]|uniref:Peptide chain release factor 3, chloroplastic n=1 Tax=Olea europaea subsp. europaea TaxID=158383 RepID=A0A8S0R0Z9_OLEEU|nr:peptide chain release factor 3, chloroplastic [Olea europaea subsp. europaea]